VTDKRWLDELRDALIAAGLAVFQDEPGMGDYGQLVSVVLKPGNHRQGRPPATSPPD
jgi:hypothetical protein